MSKYKLTFKLKQHTPIIHFQHDQHGATLRATELKPKLDKFLIEKFNQNNIDYSNWLIDGQEKALDYKVKVNSKDNETKIISEGRNNQYGAFFGTIGDEYRQKPKGLTFTENDIELIVICFKNELKEFIDNYIAFLFEEVNFGTRQSKGFGSFTIIKRIENNTEKNIEFSNSNYKTFFEINLINQDWFEKYKRASNDIVLLYKSIRSGINLKGRNGDRFYFKSLMFLYAKNSLNIQWEKKTIKENFFNTDLSNQKRERPYSEPLHYSSEEKKLLKDLLGLSSQESWFSYNSTIKKKEAIQNNSGRWVEVNDKNATFERFKSPIIFKPVLIRNGNTLRVYIYLKQEELDFAISVNKNFIIRQNRDSFHIKFPDSFSLDNFFNFFLDKNNFNINSHIENRFHEQREFIILSDFYNQLRNNNKLI